MLRFLHIPKTAGTSFKRYLQSAFPESPFLEFSGHRDRDEWIYAAAADGNFDPQFVGGHAPITTGIPQIDRMPTLTLLRNPIDRVMSFCHHVAEGKSAYLLKQHPPESFKIEHFLESANFELSNLQTAMLTPGWSIYDRTRLENPDADFAFESAEARQLSIGIVERLPESLFMFNKEFGIPLGILARANKASIPMAPPPTAIAQHIESMNGADIHLYSHCLERLDSKIANLRPTDIQALNTYKLQWMREMKKPLSLLHRILRKISAFAL